MEAFTWLHMTASHLLESPSRSRCPAAEPQASPALLLLGPLLGAALWPPRPPWDSLAILADKQYVEKAALVHTVQWETQLPGAEGSGRPPPSLLMRGVALSSYSPREACADERTGVSLLSTLC